MKSPTYEDLKQYCYFHRLSDDALKVLAARLQTGEVPAGTEIIREGEPADSFYFISNGEVEVSKETEFGQRSVLSVVGEGSGIGEMALLTSLTRTATVTAKTDITFFTLSKQDFNEIVSKDSTFSSMLQEKAAGFTRANEFKTLQPFALLPHERMAALTSKLVERTFYVGEHIITQGEEGDIYYIIKSGSVGVFKLMFDIEPEKVAALKEGEGFGEEALITDLPRNATVQASEETVVWMLSREDFDEIMRSAYLDEVFPEDLSDKREGAHALLDVRMDMEFNDEHIPDAINIPLDELRKRYDELDPEMDYYVYCLGGARSASAAFLLQGQGFNAKSIKGGIGAWEGPLTEGSSSGIHKPSATPT